MALGDGIRRNISTVDPTERMMLRDAILAMHQRKYPGNAGDRPPGGVSWWFKQDEIHEATHVHGGPEFLPWHRELMNHFEGLLRQINPQLSLHYWDFKEDPRNIPNGNIGGGAKGLVNLFEGLLPDGEPFMGSSTGSAGVPWLPDAAKNRPGFYDPQAGSANHPPNRDVTGNPLDPPANIRRTRLAAVPNSAPAPFFTQAEENAVLALQRFGPGLSKNFTPHSPNSPDPDNRAFDAAVPNFFRTAWEEIHDLSHVYFGNVSPHIAFRDPWVYLLHSNVDRLFAMWQTDPNHPERLDANIVYGSESNLDVTANFFGLISQQNLTHNVEPFSTGHGQFKDIRPWFAPENQGVPHDYHDPSVVAPPRYDTFLLQFDPSPNQFKPTAGVWDSEVTLFGRGFDIGKRVRIQFGPTDGAGRGAVSVTPTRIVVTVPAATGAGPLSGPVQLIVTNDAGSVTSDDMFDVIPT
jgi:Common central domain of tyrosinase